MQPSISTHPIGAIGKSAEMFFVEKARSWTFRGIFCINHKLAWLDLGGNIKTKIIPSNRFNIVCPGLCKRH